MPVYQKMLLNPKAKFLAGKFNMDNIVNQERYVDLTLTSKTPNLRQTYKTLLQLNAQIK